MNESVEEGVELRFFVLFFGCFFFFDTVAKTNTVRNIQLSWELKTRLSN